MTTVTLSRAGLALDGRPHMLLAGQIHYFRWPQVEWPHILGTARAAGLNTVDTVIPWNLHEPRPGRYEFGGYADLPAYLDLCATLGLRVIARPGPYICAEWENGGLPAWLAAIPGMHYRVDNPAYLQALAAWFDVLMPILAERQADRGGPVILLQIENEHWASGVYGHDNHQVTLLRLLAERGITVPFYTCMGAMPGVPEFRNGWAGIDQKLLETRRCWPDNPLIVSELWSGWFDNWGASAHTGKSPAALDARLHELTAIGASGLSHWMWAGGTNFGYWGGRTVGGNTVHMATSYDYDAPVSEYGAPREKFYVARRHHLFLSSLGARLAALVADAEPGGPPVLTARSVPGRSMAGGDLLRQVRRGTFTASYLRNDTLDRQTYQVFTPSGHLAVDVEPGSIKPVFTELPLNDGDIVLRHHTGRILGFWEHADHDVLALYGYPGEQGEVALAGAAWQMQSPGHSSWCVEDGTLRIHYWLTDRPAVLRVSRTARPRPGSEGGQARPLQIVLLTQARAERCWPLGEHGFLTGPDYVAACRPGPQGQLALQVSTGGPAPAYWIDQDGEVRACRPPRAPGEPAELALGPWEPCDVLELSAAGAWQPAADTATGRPLPFEALGCYLGYGWYRFTAAAPGDGPLALAAPGLADRGHLFVDGQYAGTFGVGPAGPALACSLTLAAGEHDLRLLVDNLGRFNYGSGLGEHKGLTDHLYLGGEQQDLTRGWSALWQEAAFAGEAIAGAQPAYLRPDAYDVDLANFAWRGPDLWLLREFSAGPSGGDEGLPSARRALVYVTGDRNPGAFFVNGRPLLRFSRHFGGGFFKYDITDLLQPGGPNVLALHVRDYAGLPWHVWLLTYDPGRPVTGDASFRSGITPTGTWLPAPDGNPARPALEAGGPRFWRSHFAYDPTIHGDGPFCLDLYGMDKGQIWLNGHNLGRYWQIGPQELCKAPASWMTGQNELLVLAEGGHPPAAAALNHVKGTSTTMLLPGRVV